MKYIVSIFIITSTNGHLLIYPFYFHSILYLKICTVKYKKICILFRAILLHNERYQDWTFSAFQIFNLVYNKIRSVWFLFKNNTLPWQFSRRIPVFGTRKNSRGSQLWSAKTKFDRKVTEECKFHDNGESREPSGINSHAVRNFWFPFNDFFIAREILHSWMQMWCDKRYNTYGKKKFKLEIEWLLLNFVSFCKNKYIFK